MSDDQVVRFYGAVGRNDRRTAHRLARSLLRTASSDDERARWRKWYEATKRGHRVLIKNYPVEIIVGADYEALERGRREMQDESLIERLAEQEDDQ